MPSGPKKRRAARRKKASAENPQELEPQTDVESKEVVVAAAAAEEIGRNTDESPQPPPSSHHEAEKVTVNEVLFKKPEDGKGLKPIADSNYNAEGSKQENLGNMGIDADHEKPVQVVVEESGKTAVNEVVVEEPEDSKGVQPIADFNFNAEEKYVPSVVAEHKNPNEVVFEELGESVVYVVVEEPEDHKGVQPIVEFYEIGESKQENLENPDSDNLDDVQVDVSPRLNDLGSAISTGLETVPAEPDIEAHVKTGSYSEPELSGKNVEPRKLEHSLAAEFGPMFPDHGEPDGLSSEVLPSPISDDSHPLKTNVCDSDPTNGTEMTISRNELGKIMGLLGMRRARNDHLKKCLEAAVDLDDELHVALTELLKHNV